MRNWPARCSTARCSAWGCEGVVALGMMVVGWVLFAWVSRVVMRNPRGDVLTGVVYHAVRAYAALVHRVRIVGRAHVPAERIPGPLIVVCNHTAGVDPLLVSSAVPFEVRWMMGGDMMSPRFRAIGAWTRVIPVNRKGRDVTSAREALRVLNEGGVVGVFPEGRLERPPGRLLPFHSGVGLLIARSGAPVMPIWITGTPQVDPAWRSLVRRSTSRLTIGPLMRFEPGQTPQAITADLVAWFRDVSGWSGGGPGG